VVKMAAHELAAAAAQATYVGSPAHKAPHSRSDATRCPADMERSQGNLTAWLRQAIAAGNVGGLIEGGFPRYVWYRDEERFFEGRLTNQMRGEYKGYPIDRDEVPKELQLQDA
jgi:hypothetical protein